MAIKDMVPPKLRLELAESQNQRDARVEELWQKLDPQRHGELDFKGMQKGLRRIDHPLKNADDMLKGLIRAVDTNGDGRIQYEEFRTFVQKAEQQLWELFNSIDRDGDGRLEQSELHAAFRQARLVVPKRRLTEFFNEIDLNNDGYISFDEWRDFLLFMPSYEHASPLHAVLSYYSSIVTLTAEGDSMVSDETLEGLGTTSGFLVQTLFGSLLKIATPATSSSAASDRKLRKGINSEVEPQPSGCLASDVSAPKKGASVTPIASLRQTSSQKDTIATSQQAQAMATAELGLPADAADDLDLFPSHTLYGPPPGQDVLFLPTEAKVGQPKFRLTEFLPEPGYFVAGALAGGISRTATAPLDRLKVYLLVNTKTSSNLAADALKSGRPLQVIRGFGRPVTEAVMDLWRSGGFRTFFAGNGLNVVKIMPETAIKFGSYEAAKRTLAQLEGHNDPKSINSYSKFLAGGIAGMIAQFSVYPLDTLKFRLQCETVKGGLSGNALLIHTAKTMYASGGVRACYRGITMGLVGMFPYSAIDMGTFEFLKKSYKTYKARRLSIHEDDVLIGNVMTGIIGATSGAFGATAVYPLNVLRTRLQTQGTRMHPPTYTGIWDVAQKTLTNEGIRGMYKGLTPNLAKVAPALSITWIVYENSKRLMKLD